MKEDGTMENINAALKKTKSDKSYLAGCLKIKDLMCWLKIILCSNLSEDLNKLTKPRNETDELASILSKAKITTFT